MLLENTVAVVTGGSRGLGEGIARRFVREGASVCIAARDQGRLDRLAASLNEPGRKTLTVRCDVTSSADVDSLAKAVLERFGRVDVLINNAGALSFGSFLEESDEQWQEMLDVNLSSARLVTRAFLPSMLEAGAGRIVFVSSNAAKKGFPNDAGYSVAKAGLMALTRVLAVEYGTRGIDVYSILPGLVADTDMGESVVADHVQREEFGGSRDKFYEWANPLSPKGHHPTVDSIVDLVTFLATPAAGVLHGQCLTADYGMTPY